MIVFSRAPCDPKQRYMLPAAARGRDGMQVARTLPEVIAAWQLVYETYRHTNFIDPNAYLIHTTQRAVAPNTVVLYLPHDGQVQSTITAIPDGPSGLPLDDVYPKELARLRRSGRRICEGGLLADQRQIPDRKSEGGALRRCRPSSRTRPGQTSLVEMMRFAVNYGRSCFAVTDLLIGVHPRHARFYSRGFGFEPYGPPRTHPRVNHQPVVLLRCDLERARFIQPIPFVLAYCFGSTVSPEVFDARYRFPHGEKDLYGRTLDGYLTYEKARRSAVNTAPPRDWQPANGVETEDLRAVVAVG